MAAWVRRIALVVVLAVVASVSPSSASAQQAPSPTQDPGPVLVADVPVNRPPVGGPAPEGSPPALGRGPERTDMRTERARTFPLSDGSFETVLSQTPVHFADEQGDFQVIDPTLVRSAGGGWHNRAAGYHVDVPPTLAAAPVRVERGGQWVSFALEGVSDAPAQVEGPTARYGEVLPGVDVTVTAREESVKEELVLAGPGSARAFRYSVAASAGLRPRLEADRSVVFLDAEDNVALSFVAPFMVDASGTLDAHSSEVAVTLDEVAGGWSLAVTPDSAWLDDPARAWPVVVDPTATFGSHFDCSISSGGLADINYCASPRMRIGYDGTYTHRALMDFGAAYDLTGVVAPGGPVSVLGAQLSLKFDSTSGAAFDANVHGVTKHFDNGATWNNRTAAALWTSPGGDYISTVVPGSTRGVAYNSSTTDGVWGAEPGRQYWYPTAMVQQWMDKEPGEWGLLLKAHTEGTTAPLMVFHSSEATTPADRPQLKIQWTRALGDRSFYSTVDETINDRSQVSVNVAGGNAMVGATDVSIAGTAGHDLVIARTYNSLRQIPVGGTPDTFVEDFGPGWTGTADSTSRLRLYNGDQRVAYTHPTGYTASFLRSTSTTYSATSRIDATLTENADGTFTLAQHHSGIKEHFNAAGQLRFVDDRNGNRIQYLYTNGRISSIVDTLGRVTTFGRNAAGQVDTITDPTSRVYRYGYTNGYLTSYTDPNNGVTGYGYNADGRLETITDPRNNATTLTYVGSGSLFQYRVATVTRSAGRRATYAYGPPGVSWAAEKNTVTDARNNTTTHYVDRKARVVKTVDALGHERSTGYDTNSNVLSYTDRTGGTPTTNTYSTDGRNNLLTTKIPTGATDTFTYGDADNLYAPDTRKSPQGKTTTFSYNAAGNLETTRDQQSQCTGGCTTTTKYKTNGTIETVTDARGKVTTYHYDPNQPAHLVRITPPAPLGETKYTYDGLSRVATMTDGMNQLTTYTYDGLDRVKTIDPAGTALVSYTYDLNGNRTGRTDSAGTTTITYDALNRVKDETFPGARTNAYTYDGVDNLITVTDATGKVTYEYNTVNLLNKLIEPSGHFTTFEYDVANNRRFTRYPNGVVQESTYDNSNRITRVIGTKGTTVLTDSRYTYNIPWTTTDTALRQTFENQSSENITNYDYDAVDRLTYIEVIEPYYEEVQETQQYTYDAAGNRLAHKRNGTTTASYAYNDADQMTSGAGLSYTYDANGNQTGNSAGQQLVHNSADQTTSMRKSSSSTALTVTYAGVNQVQRYSAGADTFTTNLLGVGVRTDGAGVNTSYVRDNAGGLVGLRDTSRSYYLFDGLGSVVAITNDAGTVVNRYSYDPYGVTTETRYTGAKTNPWRYTGAYQDTTTGLYKMGARYYQPELGRWTQPDPSGQEANAYAYVAGNPVNFIDPSGLSSDWGDCWIFRYNNESGSCFGGSLPEVLSKAFSDVGGLAAIPECYYAGQAGAALGGLATGPFAALGAPTGAAAACLFALSVSAAVNKGA